MVSFERGVENSQKLPQTNSFWDIGTQWFFSHSNKKKLNFQHFYNGTLCLKTIMIIIHCTLSLHLACYALRIPTDFKAVQVSSSSSGGHCRFKKKKKKKKKMHSGLGNIISMSPAGTVSFERGDTLSQKPLRPIVFEILELNIFFSYSNKIKAKIWKFLQWILIS